MKKKYLFYLGLTLFLSMFLASFLTFNVNITISILLIILLPILGWILNDKINIKTLVIFMTVASIGVFEYNFKYYFIFQKLLALDNQEIMIEAQIISAPSFNNNITTYDIKVNKTLPNIINHSFKSKLIINDFKEFEPLMSFRAKLYCESPYLRAPTKLKRYYKSKNQAIIFKLNDYENLNFIKSNTNRFSFNKFILASKKYLKSNLINSYNNSNKSGIMIGMLLGDKSQIDYTIKRNFNLAGISHLLAVSGLHLTILLQFVYLLLNKTRLDPYKSTFISILFSIFFVALTGFSLSAVRAAIMNIIYWLAKFFKFLNNSFNSLGLAMIIILIYNPFSALDIGFQLSFLATLGILIFKPKVDFIINNLFIKGAALRKTLRLFYDSLSLSISALILTFPLTMIIFGRVSLIAPITNILISPIVGLTLISISITAVLRSCYFLGAINKFFAILSSIGVDILQGTADIMANFPFSSVSVSHKYLYIWLISSFILVLVTKYILKNDKMKKYVALFIFIIFLVGKLSNDIFMLGNVNVRTIGNYKRNQIISDSRNSIVILREYDKYLLPDLDDEMKAVGSNKISYLILERDMDLKEIMKVIIVYKPYKIITDNKTLNLIKNNITKDNKEFKVINKDGQTIIRNYTLFKKTDIWLSRLNEGKMIITNKNNRLRVINDN